MEKKILAISIIFLFVITGLSQNMVGINVQPKANNDMDNMLDKLRFYCKTPDGFNSKKYEYYKEIILSQYPSVDLNNNMIIEKNDGCETRIKFPQEYLTLGPMDSAWPMLCHDTRHTSRSSYSTAGNPYDDIWRFFTDGGIDNSPVIDDNGIIYFGGNYGGLPWYLFAVYPNGTLKWRFKTGGLILGSSPAIAEDGTIYFGSWDGGLYAVNSDGSQKWQFGSGDNIASSPVIAHDGTIYFGVTGGRIYALYPNGTEKWHYDTGGIYSSPAIANDGTVYIGSWDTYFYAFNPDGSLKWRYKTGDVVKSHPSIADDSTVYFDSFDGNIYALYPDGTVKWMWYYKGNGCSSGAIGKDGTLYYGSSQAFNRFYALYPDDGSIKWIFNIGNGYISHSSPAISADGVIYFGTNIGEQDGGEIIAVNHDGTEKWRKVLATDWVQSSPSIAEDGTVYIGSTYDLDWGIGYLYAFGFQESNKPPNAPTITGPSTGNPGTDYKFYFVSTDPDNNPVLFYIDWGDGSAPVWTRELASGETIRQYKTWTGAGTFTISAKAKDTFGGESNWSTFEIKITKSRNKTFYKPEWIILLERFPILEKLINKIITINL